MKLVVTEFLSLDGVFEDPGGAEGYKYGGWTFEFNDDQNMAFKFEELKKADIQLLGRVTYQAFAKAWPNMEEQTGEFGKKMNSMPKYVVSKTIKTAAWNNSHIISDNILDEIKKLKEKEGGDILVAGSGTLIRFLMDNNLVDQLNLMVYPVVLGQGKKLFEGIKDKKKLKLVDSKSYPGGTVLLTYQLV